MRFYVTFSNKEDNFTTRSNEDKINSCLSIFVNNDAAKRFKETFDKLHNNNLAIVEYNKNDLLKFLQEFSEYELLDISAIQMFKELIKDQYFTLNDVSECYESQAYKFL